MMLPDQTIYLKPETTGDCTRIHVKIWPEIEYAIPEADVKNCSTFLKHGVMFACFEHIVSNDEFDTRMKRLANAERMKEWWAITDAMQIPLEARAAGEWWANLEEVFHQD